MVDDSSTVQYTTLYRPLVVTFALSSSRFGDIDVAKPNLRKFWVFQLEDIDARAHE